MFLLKALFKAEDEQDVRAASTAKAEQVAEMAEFNENVPIKNNVRTSDFCYLNVHPKFYSLKYLIKTLSFVILYVIK